MHLVEFQYDDMCREAEREFATLLEAVCFADACIENGGFADVFTDAHSADVMFLARAALCDIHPLDA